MSWTRSHTQLTTATTDQLWRRWINIDYWQLDDPDVEWARADGAPAQGITGVIKSHGAPAQKFVFTRVVPQRQMNFLFKLPLATMEITHDMRPADEGVATTHGVVIEGPLAPVYGFLVGRKIAAGLPGVVRRVTAGALEI